MRDRVPQLTGPAVPAKTAPFASSPAGRFQSRATRPLRRFAGCERGGILVWAAAAVPAVALLAIGATELTALTHDKSKLQDVADAAALLGARQLPLSTPAAAAEQAKAYALLQLQDMAERSTLTADAAVLPEGGLQVRLNSHRLSFFGNMLPPGGFHTAVQATALTMGRSNICVLALASAPGPQVQVTDSAEIRAPGCMVHSNADVQVASAARIAAKTTQAVGSATGSIAPAPLDGAKALADPFADKPINIPACDVWESRRYTSGHNRLESGEVHVHCGEFVVGEFATLRLQPGKHYFVGTPERPGRLAVTGHGKLDGNNVVLYFDRHSSFSVSDDADISLSGRKNGDDAGMLMIAARDFTGAWDLRSRSIRRLEGVIYMPGGELKVSGGSVFQVAQESKWTVTVTRRLSISNALNLVMNSDYVNSDVPLPLPTAGAGVRLVR